MWKVIMLRYPSVRFGITDNILAWMSDKPVVLSRHKTYDAAFEALTRLEKRTKGLTMMEQS